MAEPAAEEPLGMEVVETEVAIVVAEPLVEAGKPVLLYKYGPPANVLMAPDASRRSAEPRKRQVVE